jgi:hypothetical protein
MFTHWKRRLFPPAEDNEGLLDEFERDQVQNAPDLLIYWVKIVSDIIVGYI